MEPAGKRRKFAPKLNTFASSPPESHPSPYYHKLPHPSQIVPDAPHHSQRHEFEALARHLDEAAILINRQSYLQLPRYADVSVLLLSWQDDSSTDINIRNVQQVLELEYRYRTETWQIPTVSNPSLKLSVQIATFLRHVSPNQLLIIYYSGHGFIGQDGQLYWACSPRDDSAKLKWDGVRRLFEDVHSDMLLLLDTCSLPDSIDSAHGVKQVVAAYPPDTAQYSTPAPRTYFTACLTTALRKLRRGPPFSAHALYQEIKAISHANPNSAPRPFLPPLLSLEPEFFTMTPDKTKSIELTPLPEASLNTVTPQSAHTALYDRLFSREPAPKLTFDEARILVCTTFVGEATSDMAAFHGWLQSTPPLASQVTVEGMFLGPPTVLLISMPQALWASVQQDKIWYFLGHITSRNMASLYGKLVAQSGMVKPAADPCPSDITTGAASATTIQPPHRDLSANIQQLIPAQATRDEIPDGKASPTAKLYECLAASDLGATRKTAAADSAEIQAAKQLDALSDGRHRDASIAPFDRNSRPLAMPNVHPGFRNLTQPRSMSVLDGGSGSIGAKVKQILGKPDILCAHCTHAPFNDPSSLRKHIAATHTRPFPCAFHFGGCTSTFGSKNEWKRHIASQHLCLQFYRCSVCSRTSADGKGNEFNRKDLFTQHLRRMHAPPQVKRALTKSDNAQQSLDWDNYVKHMQLSCLIQRRHPPQRSNCPKPGCTSSFEGPTAWDEWTEHVGRHMEKGEGENLGVDALLRQYALDEDIIEPIGDNQYRLCPTLANGSTASQPGSQPMWDLHDSQASLTQSSVILPLGDSQSSGASCLLPLLPRPRPTKI